MAKAFKRRYRVVATTLRDQDVAEADRIAGILRSEGWPFPNRSVVIRAALVCLSDALRGKPPADILRYFIERRRTPRLVAPPRPDASQFTAS